MEIFLRHIGLADVIDYAHKKDNDDFGDTNGSYGDYVDYAMKAAITRSLYPAKTDCPFEYSLPMELTRIALHHYARSIQFSLPEGSFP
jgi:hypothetical protein